MFIIPLFLLKYFRYSIIPTQKSFVIPLFLLKIFHYSIIPGKKKIIFPLKRIYLPGVQYNTIGANLGYLGYADFKASAAIRNYMYHNWQTSSLTGFSRITELTLI